MTFHRTPAGPKTFLVAMLFMLVAVGCSDAVDDPVGSDADTTDGTAESVDSSDGSSDDVFAGPLTVIIPNSPGTISTTGEQRIMTALVGDTANSFLGDENNPVSVIFEPVEGDGGGESDGTWLTTNAAALGLYVSYFEFPTPGLWEVTVSVPNGDSLGSALIEVVEDSSVPNVGDPAPPSVTLTGTTAEEIGNISTDLEPDPELYDLSIADAVGNGRPTVVAFATPAFCQTALCGPTLETVKAAAAGRADLDVVHVEPFDLELAPQGVLEAVDAMFDYGLVTEPWVFVVDADGLVAATFEGIIGQPELEAAIERLDS
ncbi:MAG: hypothetical protein ACRBK7_32870 [Acidimicrobiales bacterium]